MIEFISQPWPWYVAGPILALIMFLLLYTGKNFGVSANLRTMCSIGGAGRWSDFFNFNWQAQSWNLVFVLGAIIGGYISHKYLLEQSAVELAPAVVQDLKAMGFDKAGEEFYPSRIFSWDTLFSWQGVLVLIGGGFMIGFGARYAGGCTSGHAISGLSDLQWPSLLAVVGFFIGGLFMTYIVLPLIFSA
jgi:hypothetical protein